MRFIDLYAGVGGFRLGLKKASKKYKCVWSCENDKFCRQVYRKRFGETPAGDVRDVDERKIPDHDLLCAGFPCQSFSIAGKRRGFEDTRGTLFYEIRRIAGAKRPQVLLLENVAGLLSAQKREAFQVVLQSLDELGYDAEWQVLNSKNFGVPQNRPRVYIVGHLGGFRGRQIFPVLGGDKVDGGMGGEAEAEGSRMGDEKTSRSLRGGDKWEQVVVSAIDRNYWKGRGGGRTVILSDNAKRGNIRAERTARKLLHTSFPGDPREYKKVAPSVQTPAGGRHLPLVTEPRFVGGLERYRRLADGKSHSRNFRQGGRVYSVAGTSPSLSADPVGGVGGETGLFADGVRIRKLTPVECERLQGFPDGWTRWGLTEGGESVEISDTQRYKMMGNAVTVNVVEFIGRRLMEAYDG